MLVLTRKTDQSIRITDGVTTIDVTLVRTGTGSARIGIDAPERFQIVRMPEGAEWLEASNHEQH
jgi:carbon storage regulator CsrA